MAGAGADDARVRRTFCHRNGRTSPGPGRMTAPQDRSSAAGSPTAAPSYLAGASWAGLNAIASVLLPFALFVFFARELRPALVGVVAFTTACVEVFKAIGLPGVYEALLQQDRDVERCHQTALALLLAASAVLLPACLLTLYGLGYRIPGLHSHFGLLALLTLRIPLDLLTLQPQAVLVARLAFRRLALRTIVANVVAGAAGVAIATFAQPVVGLVAYQLIQSLLTFASTAAGHGVLARPRLHRDSLRSLRGETLPATGNRLLAATINSLDQMAIAPLAGDVGLANYNLGKRLETTFVTIANSFSSILFQPLFAADGALTRHRATLRALSVLTLTCGVPAALLFTDSVEVVRLLFGPRWLAAAPVVAALALNGFVRAIGMVPGSLLSVTGRNRALLTTSIVSAAGSLALVAALAWWSIAACAIAMVAKNAAIVGWMAWLTRRDAPPASTYAMSVLVPMGAMVAAAAFASGLVPSPPDASLVARVVCLVPPGLAALCAGGAWIGLAGLVASRASRSTFVSPGIVPQPSPQP